MASLGEKCGVFGVYSKGLDAARLVYFGLWALQHRGQETSGIAASDGKVIRVHKGGGLVSQVYNEKDVKALLGSLAIGHNRYGTSGSRGPFHAQPVFEKADFLALAHNGNLPSTKKLEKFLKLKDTSTKECNDSELMQKALNYFMSEGLSIEEAVKRAWPLFTGVFCLLLLTRDKMVALRDAYGVRPLSVGQLNGGYVFSSETCAFDTIGAAFLRDVAPGEMLVVDRKGLTSYGLEESRQKLDIFEFIYFARPDSLLLGKRVSEVRRRLGINLAKEHPISADIVVPVPDSGIPAALGYSQELGIPFDQGLIKNRYIHRTFISPGQRLRSLDVQLKLNPIPEAFQGKRVVVVDDSIIRGTTSKRLIEIVRRAGAREVHLAISSPPARFPDFYGIDTPRQKALIAARMSVPQIKKHIGADSLSYLSYKGMISATGLPEELFCTSQFTGDYPVDIAERSLEISRKVPDARLLTV